MGNKILGQFMAKAQIIGQFNFYADVACTQPITGLSAADFGDSPPEGGEMSKKVTVFVKNEVNYASTLSFDCDNPKVELLVSTPDKPSFNQGLTALQVGEVMRTVIGAAYNAPGDGLAKTFTVTAARKGSITG